MRIRTATPEDIDAVAALFTELWPQASFADHRREADALLRGRPLSTLPLTVFVAEEEPTAKIVGLVEVGLRSHADGCDPSQPCGFIEGWYVAPEQRRRGVGRRLIERAEAWACDLGCKELGSDTWLANEESQLAHVALGFEVVDRCVNYRKPIAVESKVRGASTELETFYGAELARIHHEHFGMVAQGAARELLTRLERAAIRSGTIVDLAAGSGILSHAVAEAGFDAFGVDMSAAMLQIARSEPSGARFVCDSLWNVELPRAVAVAAIGEAFSYATDPVASPDALERRLADIYESLLPGGILLFDVAGPGRSGPERLRRSFWTDERTALGLEEREDDETLTRRITLFVAVSDLYRRVEESHRLRLYRPARVETALEKVGFSAERLLRYDTYELPSGWHAFLARKKV